MGNGTLVDIITGGGYIQYISKFKIYIQKVIHVRGSSSPNDEPLWKVVTVQEKKKRSNFQEPVILLIYGSNS